MEIIHSWVLYTNSNLEVSTIQGDIDNLFANYSFYPEMDWGKYGYRPPEGYKIFGGWRQLQSRVFAFLLSNSQVISNELILYVSGEQNELFKIEEKIKALKSKYRVEERKEVIGIKIDERVDKFNFPRSSKIFTTVLMIFTGIVNVFSLYLRELPAPKINNATLLDVYYYIIITIHYSALTLLLLVILFTILILIKFGILLIKKI